MPRPGYRWYHLTLGTHNSWLPGDPRGFRSRDHKLHSSGDHRNPPPKGEHAGLHAYSKALSGVPVRLSVEARERVGQALLDWMHSKAIRVLAVAVGAMHTHVLCELPADTVEAKRLIGIMKKSASQKIGDTYPGRVWCRGCGLKPIRDAAHQRAAFDYIVRHRAEGAWVWSFRDEPGGGEKDGYRDSRGGSKGEDEGKSRGD